MKSTADFLDLLRDKLKLPSDGQLADRLGIHRQYISRYRRLTTTFDDAMSIKIADLLEMDTAYVIACMHYQRASGGEIKKIWERIADRLAASFAVVAIGGALILSASYSPTSEAESDAYAFSHNGQVIHYANACPPCVPVALLIALFGFLSFNLPRCNNLGGEVEVNASRRVPHVMRRLF